MTVWRKYVYESRNHRLEKSLPPKVENFLVELFQEPRRFKPSHEHEKLQAALVSSWSFLIKEIPLKIMRVATLLLVIFPRN